MLIDRGHAPVQLSFNGQQFGGSLATFSYYSTPAASSCSPTRSSLLSGRLPMHVNQENSATEQRFAGIPLGMTVFVERLASEAGYDTAHVGKWQ